MRSVNVAPITFSREWILKISFVCNINKSLNFNFEIIHISICEIIHAYESQKKKKRIIKLDSLFAWRWSCPLAPRILIFVIMIFCNYFDFFIWFREVHTFFRETNFARACKFLLKHSLKHKQFIWYQFKSNLVSKIVINSLPFIKIWCILMNSVFCFIIF